MRAGASGESSVAIPVDLRRFPWIRRLAADYAYDFQLVAPFFAGNPADDQAWAQALSRTTAHERDRSTIAEVIRVQQEQRGAPPAAMDAGRRLGEAGSVAIVTGQQAGLFGGPMFTILKAITALKLAARVEREHGTPAVAVFWIDGEDHDWEEVRSCTVFDDTLAPRRVSLPQAKAQDSATVASVRLDDAVVAALDELERALADTEFKAELMAGLRKAYAPGAGMAEAFGRWLERVLGDRGLVVFDASDQRAKPLVAGVFARELSTGETGRLAARAGAELLDRGYHSQVQPAPDYLALFRLEGGRRSIRHLDGAFQVGDRQYPAPSLVQEANDRPGGFSPNVLLRPIVQDTLFPTVCYVAGPNELGYLGQLAQVYRHFGVPMPLMYPRASATIVDSAALKFLTRYEVPFESLQPQDEKGLNELLLGQIPPEVDRAFAAAADAIEAEMGRLIAAIPALDPTLEGAARSTLGRMQHDLKTLQNKMVQAAKRRDETLRRQYARARALAFPNGHPQEREIGFISFLNQYGPAFVERLEVELPLDLGRHWIVSI